MDNFCEATNADVMLNLEVDASVWQDTKIRKGANLLFALRFIAFRGAKFENLRKSSGSLEQRTTVKLKQTLAQ